MSDADNLPEEEKSGLGFVGGTASLAGGVVAGGVASGIVNKHNVVKNLAAPGVDAIAKSAELINVAAQFPEGASAKKLKHAAEDLYREVRGSARGATNVAALAEGVHQDWLKTDTVLGTAREAAQKAGQPKAKALAKETVKGIKEAVGKVANAAAPAERAAAVEELGKTIFKGATARHTAGAAETVAHVPWLKKVNPFSDLHLTGKQRIAGVAITAATVGLGAWGSSKLVSALGGGSSSQER